MNYHELSHVHILKGQRNGIPMRQCAPAANFYGENALERWRCVCVCCHMSKRSAIIINLRQICDIRVHYPIFLLHTNIVKVSFRWISQFDCWTADDLFELNKDDGFALTDSKPIPLFTDHRTFNVHIHHMCVQFRILSTSIFNLNFYIR